MLAIRIGEAMSQKSPVIGLTHPASSPVSKVRVRLNFITNLLGPFHCVQALLAAPVALPLDALVNPEGAHPQDTKKERYRNQSVELHATDHVGQPFFFAQA